MITKYLDDNWENFKSFVVEYCIEKTIENLKRYKNEKVYEFLERAEIIRTAKNISEQEMLNHLKTTNLPNRIKIMLINKTMNLEGIIKFEKEYSLYFNEEKKRRHI